VQADYTVAERWHEDSRALVEDIGDQHLLSNVLNDGILTLAASRKVGTRRVWYPGAIECA
jgi:hypothetical protein